jgi:hypothetical protein
LKRSSSTARPNHGRSITGWGRFSLGGQQEQIHMRGRALPRRPIEQVRVRNVAPRRNIHSRSEGRLSGKSSPAAS